MAFTIKCPKCGRVDPTENSVLTCISLECPMQRALNPMAFKEGLLEDISPAQLEQFIRWELASHEEIYSGEYVFVKGGNQQPKGVYATDSVGNLWKLDLPSLPKLSKLKPVVRRGKEEPPKAKLLEEKQV